jgi:uncharacterized small protein (DUF1192 family)
MEDEDLAPVRRAPPRKNLEPLAIAELEAYIVELEDEIARTRADIAAKKARRGAAASLFKR